MRFFKKKNKEKRSEPMVGTTTRIYTSTDTDLSAIFTSNEAMRVSTLFRCITIISTSVAAMPMQLMELDKNNYGTEVNNNFSRLLTIEPNRRFTMFKVIQSAVQQLLVKGEAFIEIFRDYNYNPIELRNAYSVAIHENDQDYGLTYVISDKYGTRYRTESDVIHLTGAYVNESGTRSSIFDHAVDILKLSTSAQNYMTSYFDNNMFNDGYLSTEQNLREDQAKKLSDSWSSFKGWEGKSGTPVLYGGVKYFPFTPSPADTGSLVIRDNSVIEVARFFGVPLEKLNLRGNTATITKMEDRQFFRDCLLPYIREIQEEFTRRFFFLDSLKRKHKIIFDTKHYTELTEEEAKTIGVLVHNAVLSPNEARKMKNLAPSSTKGADDLYLNYIKLDLNQEHFSNKQKIKSNE